MWHHDKNSVLYRCSDCHLPICYYGTILDNNESTGINCHMLKIIFHISLIFV